MSNAIDEGKKLVEDLRVADARRHFETLLSNPAEQTEASVWLGKLELASGAFERAEAHLNSILEHAPQHAEALALKGLLQLRQGNSAAAARLFEDAKKKDANQELVHLHLAACYRQLGGLPDALRSAREAVEHYPDDPQIRLEFARTLWQMGDKPGALKTAAEVLGRDPAVLPVYVDLSGWLAAEDFLDLAIATLQQGVTVFPQAWELHEQLALVYLAADKLKEAATEAQLVANGRGWAEDYIFWGHCLIPLGDKQGAEQKFRLAINIAPKSSKPYIELADVLRMKPDFKAAEENYRKAASLAAQDTMPQNALGLFLMDQQRPEEALAVFQAALKLAPKSTGVSLNLAVCLGMLGRPKEAAKFAQQTRDATPAGSAAHSEAVRLLDAISDSSVEPAQSGRGIERAARI